MQTYFDQVDRVRFAGPKTDNPLAFRHYNPDEIVLGKRMADHLRFAACYWHNFCWNGADMFGAGSFERPWQAAGDALEMAKRKADVAFEFFYKLNVPYYCFHCGEVIVYAWMDRRRENSEKPYGTRLRAGLAVSARLVGKCDFLEIYALTSALLWIVSVSS